jgi:ribose/xylose/arabinose/galactoside ABC-type transport system permease subunit
MSAPTVTPPAENPAATTPGAPTRLQALGRHRSLGVSYGLALLFVIALGLSTKNGFSPERILDIVGQDAQLGMAVIGQAVVMLSGGLDLSIGPVMNLASIVSAVIMDGSNGNIPLAVVLTIAAGGAVGVVNGLLVAKLRIAPLLATLAVGTILQGVYYVWTEGQPKGSVAPGFKSIADDRILGFLPISIVVWFVLWGVVAFVLYRTTWGKGLYATGANPRAAWLSGIATSRKVIGAYVIAGMCAAVAGMQLTAYSGAASVNAADSYTLTTVAAAVIGGVAFAGGIGGLAGPFAGVLVLVFLDTILETLGVPSATQYIAQGLILIIMMLVSRRLNRGARGRDDA